MEDFEHKFEHYLQGHIHPDVQPQVRREVKLEHISMQGFLRIMEIVELNHRALDDDLKEQTRPDTAWDETMLESRREIIERTPTTQLDFESHWKWGQM